MKDAELPQDLLFRTPGQEENRHPTRSDGHTGHQQGQHVFLSAAKRHRSHTALGHFQDSRDNVPDQGNMIFPYLDRFHKRPAF